MILTPQELQDTLTVIKFPQYLLSGEGPATKLSVIDDAETTARFLETVRAYAEVVQRVAEKATPGMWGIYRYCPICETKWIPDQPEKHRDGCVGLAARKLRGLDD
jgi:hypothetical protein